MQKAACSSSFLRFSTSKTHIYTKCNSNLEIFSPFLSCHKNENPQSPNYLLDEFYQRKIFRFQSCNQKVEIGGKQQSRTIQYSTEEEHSGKRWSNKHYVENNRLSSTKPNGSELCCFGRTITSCSTSSKSLLIVVCCCCIFIYKITSQYYIMCNICIKH